MGGDDSSPVSAIASVAGDAITAGAQENEQTQQEQNQANLQGQGIQTQLDYNNTEENALRQAIGGVTGEGNPFFDAVQGLSPSFLAPGGAPGSGSFGAGSGGGTTATFGGGSPQLGQSPGQSSAPAPPGAMQQALSPIALGIAGAAPAGSGSPPISKMNGNPVAQRAPTGLYA